MALRYHIGTSGWHYDHWIDRFYPKGLSKRDWLDFYAREFPTVEINLSFYRLPTEKAFDTWRRSAPEGFLFAVKASRFITHFRKLQNAQRSLDLFLGRARLLGEKLGPILFQLPPNWKRNAEVLGDFLSLLPKDLRHVFEFRHPSWFAPEVYRLLAQHDVALCTYDLAGFDCPLETTTDFVYHRFHGDAGGYGGFYSDEKLGEWAKKIERLAAGRRDAFVYFNNDAQANAVRNALTLAGLFNQQGP